MGFGDLFTPISHCYFIGTGWKKLQCKLSDPEESD